MERAAQIAAFWNWLPVFRVVAEREHIGQAAESLGLSKPAVSRTVSLLEEELGIELVVREGRGIRLTVAGTILQGAVRDAMRTVHEASLRFQQSEFMGPLRISSVTPASLLLLEPALPLLAERFPGVEPEITTTPVKDVQQALLRGRLDVALLAADLAADGISVERIGEVKARVYAPCSLSLPDKRRFTFADLSVYPWVALKNTHGDDPYPLFAQRRVLMKVETYDQAREVAQNLGALTVLPEDPEPAGMQLVPTPALRAIPLSVAWRNPLHLRTAADAFVEAIKERASSS